MNYNRTKNALLGLAAGDALNWQALYHKSYDLPFWTRRLRREIDVESEKYGINKLNLPFSLNVPVKPFYISSSAGAEWAAFTGMNIIKCSGIYDFKYNIAEWKKLSLINSEIRGSIAVKGALINLGREINPPASGNDNPHYFDDSAMMRAIVIGSLFPGNKEKAAELAGADAQITNALEGVWAAKAMAAAVSTACGGGDVNAVIAASVEQVQESVWILNKINTAMEIVKKHNTIFSALPVLYDEITDHSYNYGVSAPENLALTLALFSLAKGDLTVCITAATSLAKTSDSVPAFAGALCGALLNEPFDEGWTNRFESLKGICIPSLKGISYKQMAEQINSLAINNSKQR